MLLIGDCFESSNCRILTNDVAIPKAEYHKISHPQLSNIMIIKTHFDKI